MNANKTPGYNVRLRIARTADKHGRPVAYYWSGRFGAPVGTDGRWIRMSLAAAIEFLAQEQADAVPFTKWTDPQPSNNGN